MHSIKMVVLACSLLFTLLLVCPWSTLSAFAKDDNWSAALRFYQQKDYSDAIRCLAHVCEYEPDNALARYYLANCYVYDHHFPAAAELYKSCLQLGPDRVTADYCHRAIAKLNVGLLRFDQGTPYLAASSLITTAGAKDLVTAISYYRQHDYPQTILRLQRLLRSEPTNALAHYYLANCYVSTGDFQHACTQYSLCLESGTDGDTARYCWIALSRLHVSERYESPSYRQSIRPYVSPDKRDSGAEPYPIKLVGPAGLVGPDVSGDKYTSNDIAPGSVLVPQECRLRVMNYESVGAMLDRLPPIKPLLAKEKSNTLAETGKSWRERSKEPAKNALAHANQAPPGDIPRATVVEQKVYGRLNAQH